MALDSRRARDLRVPPGALVICYSFALLASLAIRPLWLDEVLELLGTTSPSVESLIRWVLVNPGGVPLGYLTERPFVLAGGPSAFWARFPSALFSAASCWLIVILCRELKLSRTATLLAAGIFMVLPAQFRYATEARPYSEALCFVLVAMVAIARWASQPSFGFLYLFVPAMVAALYTQPFTVFAACGLVAWTAASGFLRGERWRAAVPPACLCASLLMFLPWYLFSSRQWDSSIEQSGYPKFHWTLGLAEDVLKGISGGAFLCSLIFLLLVAIGARSGSREIRGLLLSCASFALVGALATDAWKNYFFASRQILFAVPALAIIAAAGLEKALRRSKLLGIAVGGTLLIASLQKDTTMQINAKENWSAAANALAQVSRDGYCVKMAGGEPGGVAMYSVFVPNLASGLCGDFARQSKVALVSNIATSTTALNASKEELRGLGFVREKTMAVGGTTIEIETR